MRKSKERGFVQAFLVLILLVGLGLGVWLVQNKTNLFSKAAPVIPQTPETSFELELEKNPEAPFPDDPTPQNITAGSKFRVDIWARSDIDPANMFAAKLKFNPDELQVVDVKDRGNQSFVNQWIKKDYDNARGYIDLIGGVPAPGLLTSTQSSGNVKGVTSVSPPANPSASCTYPGTTANLTWTGSPGATRYDIYAFDTTVSPTIEWDGIKAPCGSGNRTLCQRANNTSYSFNTTPGHNYQWFVFACDNNGCSAPASYSTTFNCTKTAPIPTLNPSISPPSTLTSPIPQAPVYPSAILEGPGTVSTDDTASFRVTLLGGAKSGQVWVTKKPVGSDFYCPSGLITNSNKEKWCKIAEGKKPAFEGKYVPESGEYAVAVNAYNKDNYTGTGVADQCSGNETRNTAIFSDCGSRSRLAMIVAGSFSPPSTPAPTTAPVPTSAPVLGPSRLMASIIFEAKKEGSAKVEFTDSSQILRNFDGANIISAKKGLTIPIVAAASPESFSTTIKGPNTGVVGQQLTFTVDIQSYSEDITDGYVYIQRSDNADPQTWGCNGYIVAETSALGRKYCGWTYNGLSGKTTSFSHSWTPTVAGTYSVEASVKGGSLGCNSDATCAYNGGNRTDGPCSSSPFNGRIWTTCGPKASMAVTVTGGDEEVPPPPKNRAAEVPSAPVTVDSPRDTGLASSALVCAGITADAQLGKLRGEDVYIVKASDAIKVTANLSSLPAIMGWEATVEGNNLPSDSQNGFTFDTGDPDHVSGLYRVYNNTTGSDLVEVLKASAKHKETSAEATCKPLKFLISPAGQQQTTAPQVPEKNEASPQNLRHDGDVNSDDKFTLSDMSAMLSQYGKTDIQSEADINGDGVINTLDILKLRIILTDKGAL